MTNSVEEPITDTEDVESETDLLAIEKDRLSELGLSTNNASLHTSDHCPFIAGEHDEASDVLNNLGYTIKPLMCMEEVFRAVSSLSAGQKYKLLMDYYKPCVDFPFLMFFIATAAYKV